MARHGPYFYLREDEDVLLRVRAVPTYAIAVAVAPVVAASALLTAVLIARQLLPRLAEAVPANAVWSGWTAIILVAMFVGWRRAATTEYAITNERVYARVGRLVTQLHFTTHDKVTDIRYRQGPFERLLGLEGLTFATAGGEVAMPGVRDALAIKATSETARDGFIRALLADAPAPEGATGTDAESAPALARPTRDAPPEIVFEGGRPDYLQTGDVPVWRASPRLIASVSALRSVLGIIPILLFSNALDPPRRALAILLAVGAVLMFLAARLMQLRRTEYVATDRRVYARRGVVGTTVSQLTYEKITDITYHQSFVGRILGFGTVTVQTAGGSQAPISMVGLADPLAAKEAIEGWRDAAVEARS